MKCQLIFSHFKVTPLVIKVEEVDKALDIIEETIEEYVNGRINDEALSVVQGW